MKTESIHISHRLAPKIIMLSIICAVGIIHPPSVWGAPANIEFVQSAGAVDVYDFLRELRLPC